MSLFEVIKMVEQNEDDYKAGKIGKPRYMIQAFFGIVMLLCLIGFSIYIISFILQVLL